MSAVYGPGMTEMGRVLGRTAEIAAAYLAGLDERDVFPTGTSQELLDGLGGPLQPGPIDPTTVIEELAAALDSGLVANAGGRYFGFVTGGAVPASVAADWLTAAWDQNAFSFVSSPAASVVEEVAANWVRDLLRLPESVSTAFVTGCQMAHVTCLAAARQAVLDAVGWDVGTSGLGGAPRIRVVTGEKRHVTVDRAVRLLGIGSDALELVAVDRAARMIPECLSDVLSAGEGPVIVVAQAGEVNTGSFDPLGATIDVARDHGAWVHVDGAFGIWARVSAELSEKVDRLEDADSWAFDAHKWLNVPYDCGIAMCAHPDAHRAAMLYAAAYLMPTSAERDACDWTPDASRRARGIAVYAALRSLGSEGVAAIVDRCCRHARGFAARVGALPGAVILNDVELNQVLFRFSDDETTERVLNRVQRSGAAWMSGTTWEDRAAVRVSISNWATTDEDIARTVEAFRTAVEEAG